MPKARRVFTKREYRILHRVIYNHFFFFESGGRSLPASAVYSSNCFVQIAANSRNFSGLSFARFLVSERSELRSYSSHGLFFPAATIFQSPTRRARLPSCSHQSESCETAPSFANRGSEALAGRRRYGLAVPFSRPLARRPPRGCVGTRSMICPAVCRISPRAAIPFGQWTINGVEMPAFVNPGLVSAERRVGQTRPARPDA